MSCSQAGPITPASISGAGILADTEIPPWQGSSSPGTAENVPRGGRVRTWPRPSLWRNPAGETRRSGRQSTTVTLARPGHCPEGVTAGRLGSAKHRAGFVIARRQTSSGSSSFSISARGPPSSTQCSHTGREQPVIERVGSVSNAVLGGKHESRSPMSSPAQLWSIIFCRSLWLLGCRALGRALVRCGVSILLKRNSSNRFG